MSKYADYSKVARKYDDYRSPEAADVEVAMMQLYADKPLKDLHVLDAGGGTGNHAKAFLGYGVGKVTLLDASMEMLEEAKSKLEPEVSAGKQIVIEQATLPEIPLQTGTVDAITFNSVLHHLVSKPDGTTFPEIENAIAEAHRVLRPGGSMFILDWTPSIIKEGLWFTGMRKSIGERGAKRYPTNSQYGDIFSRTNFQRLNVMHLCLTELMHHFHNPEGPLDKDWRESSLLFKVATEEELHYVQNEVRRMKDAGTLEAYVNDHDNTYATGIHTLFIAKAL